MKIDEYRQTLRASKNWEPYLLKHSGLPGPRGNIELGQAVADEGDKALFSQFISLDVKTAPVNSPQEFLVFCGTVGFGKLLAEGDASALKVLRRQASDPRWRTREGVAMALQRLGDVDMDALVQAMRVWSKGNLLEQRAAIAALCEPRLLTEKKHAAAVLDILDTVTRSLARIKERKSDEFLALKKGLAYCWSVAVAAYPQEGKAAIEKWFASNDREVIWIMKENLKKNRLARMDAAWVKKWSTRLSKPA
ncbi:MAG TPA: HEAT repeat domain-containing protein [Anaerolineae bacterium]